MIKNLTAIVAFFVILFLVGCTPDTEKVNDILEAEGLHDIQLLGWKSFSCSDDDDLNVEFGAKRTVLDRDGRPSEIEVSGVVCCGLLMKDCTIRH